MLSPANRLTSRVASIALVGLAWTPVLSAQDATRPSSGNWWEANAPAPGANRGAPAGSGSTVTDFPESQVTDWVSATAMAARARAVSDQAQSDLHLTLLRQQRHFERSADYAKARDAEEQAHADYVKARDRALVSVIQTPRYRAIQMLRDEVSDKIAARRGAKNAAPDELVSLATLKLQYASDLRAMEWAATDQDAELKSARERLVQSHRRVVEMRDQFEDSLHDNPEVAAARHNFASARIAVVQTSALACAASIASASALDYSYYLHRNDNGGAYGPYGPNGVYGSYGVVASPYWSGR